MFSSKKKNVELNLMVISQANNIGNSEIPVSLSQDHHFSPLKRVPPNTDNSFDILKNQLKRQGQQNKT
jgi:hypothetical protein